jgi:hypothetical protein
MSYSGPPMPGTNDPRFKGYKAPKTLTPEQQADADEKAKLAAMTPVDRALYKGQKKGEEVTGITSEKVGEKRGEIRGKYEAILDQPSRGAARMAKARNADLKRMKQSQSRSGLSGGMANLQNQQVTQDYASKMGDVENNAYMSALNKLEKQYRGAGGDITKLGGQYGSLEVGGQPAPQMSSGGGILDTYLCTELHRRGLVTKVDLILMHSLLIIGAILKPAQTIFYLTFGAELVTRMNENNSKWPAVKAGLFDKTFSLMKRFRFLAAINHYETVTTLLFERCEFDAELDKFKSKWSFNKVTRSFKLMWRV